MIIKKFRADTEEAAKQLVQKEMGPEAIILTVKTLRGKGIKGMFSSGTVEVTAGIEDEDYRQHQGKKSSVQEERGESAAKEESIKRLKQLLGQVEEQDDIHQGIQSDDTVAISSQAQKKNMQREGASVASSAGTYSAKGRPQKGTTATLARDEVPEAMEGLASLSHRLKDQFGSVVESKEESVVEEVAEEPAFEEVVQQQVASPVNVDELRKVIREEMVRSQKSVEVFDEEEGCSTLTFLCSKGIARSVAVRLKEKACLALQVDELDITGVQKAVHLNALKKEIASTISTTGPLLLREDAPTTVAVVGPTGVGKTTTVIKIAHQYVNQLNKKVAVITLDVGSQGKVKDFGDRARQVGADYYAAYNTQELLDTLAKLQDRDLILIDTRGRSQYYWQEIDELGEVLGEVENLKALLAISATTKDVDVYGIIQHFSGFPVEGLIFTKLDETIAQGIFVNVCAKQRQSISYITTGQEIGDIRVAQSGDLARRILVHHNGMEFQALRTMAE